MNSEFGIPLETFGVEYYMKKPMDFDDAACFDHKHEEWQSNMAWWMMKRDPKNGANVFKSLQKRLDKIMSHWGPLDMAVEQKQ